MPPISRRPAGSGLPAGSMRRTETGPPCTKQGTGEWFGTPRRQAFAKRPLTWSLRWDSNRRPAHHEVGRRFPTPSQ